MMDSGVGGLSVLAPLIRHCLALGLPLELTYLADTAWFPYGEKEASVLAPRVAHLIERLLQESNSPHGFLIACNTVVSVIQGTLLQGLQARLPVWDPITAVCQTLVRQTTPGGRPLGVMATPLTVRSQVYPKFLAAMADERQCVGIPCSGLAAAVEQWAADGGKQDKNFQAALEALKEVLAPALRGLKQAGVTEVVLGCTHYPLVAPIIQEVAQMIDDKPLQLIDPAQTLWDEVVTWPDLDSWLVQHTERGLTLPGRGRCRFVFTSRVPDEEQKYRFLLHTLLGEANSHLDVTFDVWTDVD
jgi:glutamate racemase